MASDPCITSLLESWQGGNDQALKQLSSQVYSELQRLAFKYMKSERDNHTLQPTALVNEAFVRLISAEVTFENRVHFFSLAGRMMRRILVDHARSLNRDKRGAGAQHITLHESILNYDKSSNDLLDLHEALETLSKIDPRKAEILELQFFAGLSNKEIADVVDVSLRTVERDIQFSKAWLQRELSTQ